MATTTPPPAGAGAGGPPKGYKRSWKNLLINKRYQLRFTLFMVGLSAALMLGLGVWVMRVANETTTVGIARVRGESCPKVPQLSVNAGSGPVDDGDAPAIPMQLDDGTVPVPVPTDGAVGSGGADGSNGSAAVGSGSAGSAADGSAAAGSAGSAAAGSAELAAPKADKDKKKPGKKADDDAERPRVRVVLDDSSMTLTPQVPTIPSDYVEQITAHWTCQLKQSGAIADLKRGRLHILLVLIVTGIVLIIGLAVYGIKMTHKVAGPLFKVTLYLAKMRDGRLDKVWNLRKGDQLVDFYDHFKSAHAGVVALERDDIDRLKAMIAAADAAGVGDSETIVELRAMLARKEKAVE